MTTDEALERVVATIRDEYRPERIILFGSRVWGTPDADSDLDMLVIKRSRKRELERIRDLSRLVQRFQQRPFSLPLDILVKTPGETASRPTPQGRSPRPAREVSGHPDPKRSGGAGDTRCESAHTVAKERRVGA